MPQGKDNYQLLIENLDRFTRKYYVNQLIRGLLYSIALLVLLFIVMNVLEYFYYFSKTGRKVLFYSFLGTSAIAVTGWILFPLFKYFRLGKVISHDQAAEIIGEHFTGVKDKLLNVLQLKRQSTSNANAALINASINQKTEDIKLVPFKSAINLGQNKKYLRYALPPLMLLLIMLFAAPSIIRDSTNRLINNDKEFIPDAPFTFVVDDKDLTVVQFDDYNLNIKVEGEALPNEVFIDIDGYKYRLKKEDNSTFSYQFSNVQKETDFRLFSTGVNSENYKLGVLKKPNISGFDIKLNYPAYTGRKDESLANIGDLVVPLGTTIDWVFNAQNTEVITMKFSDNKEMKDTERFSDDLFTYKKRALRDQQYKLFISNDDLPNADSVAYAITVIPDLHPSIKVEQFVDSTDNKLLFFVGDAADDYGIRNLTFNYKISNGGVQKGTLNSFPVNRSEGKQTQYDHTWDIAEMELKPGDELSYYFEVSDNDAINGSKSAKTQLMTFKKPSIEEFEDKAEENSDEIKKELEKAIKENKAIKEDMKKLREKMLQKKDMDWQTKKELEKLLERKQELDQKLDKAKEMLDENIKNQEEFSKPDEELLEKQEKIQELFEELMSPEMKELMERIQEMMEELEKEEALDAMEEMEMDDEEMEKEMDRALEMFKQLEVELEMEQAMEKLEELAKEQEELAEETEKNTDEAKQEELEKKQEELNERMEEIQKDIEATEKKNEELEKPKDLGDPQEEMEDIKKDMKESSQAMEEMQNQKASDKQKKAAEKMKEMAESMKSDMAGGQMEQMEEDMEALRQLLENLIGISFEQEDLIATIGKTNINTPRYVELVQDQYKIKDDFKLVEDSLQELSKRVHQIESYVTEKVTEIKSNMKISLDDLEERKKTQASEHQQRTMKNVNDLALMLSEVMNQMQQQMASMMEGSQMCDNPGKGKSGEGKGKKGNAPKDKLSEGQKGMGDQLKEMKDALQRGKGGSSKEFAQMAKKQKALRKALQEKQRAMQEKGQGDKQMQDIVDQMNKTETDLVNKRLTNEMLERQQEIMTRLLEAEKAEREREYDNKRKAERTAEKERKMPPSLEEYIKKREAEIDAYKAVSPELKPYYKFLVEEYFKTLKNQ